MKLTFKRQKRETGLAAIGKPNPDTIIKLDKRQVGYIHSPSWDSPDHKWTIRLMKKTGEDSFSWIKVKERFEREEDARTYIQTNNDRIIAVGLYQTEPDSDE